MSTAYLTTEQVGTLLRGIKPSRVLHLDGMSHLAAYDVRAHLNRVFGFGRWSADVLDVTPLYEQPTETKNKKPAYRVGYRATVRLTVCAPDGTRLATYTECAVGDSTMPDFKRGDCHDMAIKTAESQALKRCATNLGDQFGLSLYRNGSTDPVVTVTLVGAPEVEKDDQEDEKKAPPSVDEQVPDVVPDHLPEAATPTADTDGPDGGYGTPDDPPAALAEAQAGFLQAAANVGLSKVQALRVLHQKTGKALAEASVAELRTAIDHLSKNQTGDAA